jgi:outer membrane immunogenic protein
LVQGTGRVQIVMGIVVGFVIGVVAALLGVAGGELLIPTLVLLFGVDSNWQADFRWPGAFRLCWWASHAIAAIRASPTRNRLFTESMQGCAIDWKNQETKMKTISLVAIATVGFAVPALAADLPFTKAPPMVAAIYDWSGFYVGANGGWGSSHECWDFTTPSGAFLGAGGCHNATGGFAGGQIGYRWQASGWVFGLEAQGDWADLRGSNQSLVDPSFVNHTELDAFGLFTGQVGYAWNNLLLYVKGGAAVTDNKYTGTRFATGALVDSSRDTRWGGTAGAGLEYGFAPNWSVGVEYDHLFMDNHRDTFTTTTGAFSRTDNIHQGADLVSARVNYRWGGPLVPRY